VKSLTASGSFTYSVAGTNTLSGCQAIHNGTVNVLTCKGFIDHEPESISICPNPASGYLTVTSSRPGTLLLCDLSGKTLSVLQVVPGTMRLDVSSLRPGMYIGRIQDGGNIKIIIQ
jgi:hypothetical protein